jgi:hypothetical protein
VIFLFLLVLLAALFPFLKKGVSFFFFEGKHPFFLIYFSGIFLSHFLRTVNHNAMF